MYLGLDLSGLPSNPTGWFSLPSMEHGVAYSDGQILDICRNHEIIAIDAPLSLPSEWFRDCDMELFRLGFKPLSPRLKGMLPLVERAMKLSRILGEEGKKVIEVFAKASSSILNLSRDWAEKRAGKMTGDEFDAMACALTAMLYARGKFRRLGRECSIIVPAP